MGGCLHCYSANVELWVQYDVLLFCFVLRDNEVVHTLEFRRELLHSSDRRSVSFLQIKKEVDCSFSSMGVQELLQMAVLYLAPASMSFCCL